MAIAREVKVGAFVLAGLMMTGAMIFLIGEERSLFKPKTEYLGVFEDVEGLKRGSPVRMGGIDIGSVGDIEYSAKVEDDQLYVRMSIVASAAPRIREDSRITIAPKGLLGDKMLEITVGSLDAEPIPPGGTVPRGERSDMFARINKLGDKASSVMDNLEKTTSSLADEQLREDLKSSVHSLNSILRTIDKGDGYASRLLNDPKEADKISKTLTSLQQTSFELNRTVHKVGNIVDRVERGPGFAHSVIYGDAPTKTLQQFGDAAGEVAVTLRGIREGDGVARGLIYGDDGSQQFVGNLNAMSSDMRKIVADVRAGKGTLGALLVDPSIYEDIKMVLGNVSRNKALRALVRYSIKRDEKSPRGVRDSSPPAAAKRQRIDGDVGKNSGQKAPADPK